MSSRAAAFINLLVWTVWAFPRSPDLLMGMRARATAAFTAISIAAPAPAAPAPATLTVNAAPVTLAPPRTLFRRYAFAACLAKAIPATKPQAAAAARAYLELGAGDPEAYAQAQALAGAYLKRDYASQTGADLSLMKCLDFMDSPELAALTNQAIPKR